jgi:hypothetical protein
MTGRVKADSEATLEVDMWMRSALAAVLLTVAPSVVWSQSCEQSLAARSDKSIVSFDWLIDGNQSGLTILACPVAERMRRELFFGGVGSINQNALDNLQQYKALTKARREALIKDRDALKKALDENTATKMIAEVALYELGKFIALVGCLTPEPTMATKALCAVELGLVAKSTHDLVKGAADEAELHKRLTLVNQELDRSKQEYDRVMNLASAAGLPIALQRRKQMFDHLCWAVKQSCL